MSTQTRAPLAELEAIYAELPSVDCKRLCQACCTVTRATALEESRMRLFARGRRVGFRPSELAALRRTGVMPPCPLLRKGGCSVYAARPLICRLFGVVESMPCPHGCTVTPRMLNDEEMRDVGRRVADVSDRWAAERAA
jgi:hypothetical protein